MDCAGEIFLLLMTLAAFTGGLLVCYGIARVIYWALGLPWEDY